MRRLIESRDSTGERTDSELEDKLLRLIRSRRLPLPDLHCNVFHEDDWLGEVDFAYPHARIAIEVHGYGFHSLKPVWEKDQRRENELVRAGWKLLKATSQQLDQDPDSFLEALRYLLKEATTRIPQRPRRSLEAA